MHSFNNGLEEFKPFNQRCAIFFKKSVSCYDLLIYVAVELYKKSIHTAIINYM